MATVVTYNSKTFTLPETGEENWGGVTKVDGFLVEVANNALQKSGGLFSLSGDLDLGPTAGLKAIYYKSRGTVSTAGVIRLASAEAVGFRNNANSGNNLLTTDASDNLTYNGVAIATSLGVIPVTAGGTGLASYTTGDILYASAATTISKRAIGAANTVCYSNGTSPNYQLILNANVDPAAALARSKIAAGSTSRVVVNDGAGALADLAAATSDGMVVKSVSGAPAWAFPYSRVSKTTTYTLAVTDTHVDCDTSGAAFTVTIPAAAAGNSGQTAWIRKTTSDFNAVTLGTGVSTTLNTLNEVVQIQSNGTAWAIISRSVPSFTTTYALTIGGSVAPGEGSGATKTATYQRVGNWLELSFEYSQSNAGTAGTGNYLFPLPAGLTIDSTYHYTGSSQGRGRCGYAEIVYGGGSTAYSCDVITASSTQVQLELINTAAATGTLTGVGSGVGGLDNASVNYSLKWRLPITGWNG